MNYMYIHRNRQSRLTEGIVKFLHHHVPRPIVLAHVYWQDASSSIASISNSSNTSSHMTNPLPQRLFPTIY